MFRDHEDLLIQISRWQREAIAKVHAKQAAQNKGQ